MASVVKQRNGRMQIQLSEGEHPGRPRIRLGKVSRKHAETACNHVEKLVSAKAGDGAVPLATAEWVAAVPPYIRRRLEAIGLVAPPERRECPTLGEWLRTYIDGRGDVKKATRTVYRRTRAHLVKHFGAGRRLDEITVGHALDFRSYLASTAKLAENTVRRTCGIARQFFQAAADRRIIEGNPFKSKRLPVGVRRNPKRYYFVSGEETEAVLAACPDPSWRLVFALVRYGGLRCPSEVTRLKWSDVNWERMRFTVHARKTEHHEGGGIRVCPIFPELYPYLRDAFEAAEPGAVFCCPQYVNAAQMYRKQFMAILSRAGVKPWPKLFQNCRSTRETELCETYPVHVVCCWIGNTPTVAANHYLQVTEEHFAKAAQNPAQPAQNPALNGARRELEPSPKGIPQAPVNAGLCEIDASGCDAQLLGVTGLEPVASSL